MCRMELGTATAAVGTAVGNHFTTDIHAALSPPINQLPIIDIGNYGR